MKNYPPLPARRPTEPKTYPICSLKKALDIIKSQCGDVCISERHGEGDNKVIILPEAMRELEVMISYGRRSPMNLNEQKFTGFGHYLIDECGSIITVVNHFIEIQTMNQTAVSASNLGPDGEYNSGIDFLEYHREIFLRNEAKYNLDSFGCTVDPFLELCGTSEFVLEGHTHPDLGVFYSQTDKISGKGRAALSPVCIFVCDPIRREMLASIGKEFSKAEIIVYNQIGGLPRKSCDDKRLIHSADEIVRLTSQCLRTRGYAGDVRISTGFNGKVHLKIKLVIPKKKKREQ